MDLGPEREYQLRAAALLRAAANDLKRHDAGAESDLGLPAGSFARLTSGDAPVTWPLIRRACEIWPLNERDLLPIHDDCQEGVRIHRLASSIESSRIIARDGEPYYEYRDTAMSRVASYRPEWIRMLRSVQDSSPENPTVKWNAGHLLYQFTYFVGPVNYYYRWDGISHCAEMTTGDSVWGVPFAPHSFTSRSQLQPAYILALTYGGAVVGDAQRELAVLGPSAARQLALPVGSGACAQGELLRSFLRARMMPVGILAREAGLDPQRTSQLCRGEDPPAAGEIDAIARVLGVSARELLGVDTGAHGGVHLQRHAGAPRWEYPCAANCAYRVVRLAGDPLHPHTTGLELEVVAPTVAADGWLTTYQHQYLYLLGEHALALEWVHRGTRRSAVLAPGDSCYILPAVPVAFCKAGQGEPRALLLRIGGAVTTDVRFALSTMAEGGIERYLEEDRVWYPVSSRDMSGMNDDR